MIYSGLGVNSWARIEMGVEAARPSHCSGCEKAAHRADGRLRLLGHGIRWRGIWGPREAEGEPLMWEIQVRRYLCTDCGACPTVLPAGLLAGYRYSLSAIALALALWGILAEPATRVRQRVSPQGEPGYSEAPRWRSLRRWVRDGRKLFGFATTLGGERPKSQAGRLAHLVMARAPAGGSEVERVFLGAQAR